MNKAEQIDRREKAQSVRRELKKKVRRLRRRLERKSPEDAPGKVRELIKGYSL